METMLLQETELRFKSGKQKPSKKITDSSGSAKIFREILGEEISIYESFAVLFLNNNGKVIGWQKIASGGITACVVDVRILFSAALQCLATSIIVAHNHPSGNLRPSDEDRRITRQISEAGKVLQIQLLDHLILTEESYYSFADEGML